MFGYAAHHREGRTGRPVLARPGAVGARYWAAVVDVVEVLVEIGVVGAALVVGDAVVGAAVVAGDSLVVGDAVVGVAVAGVGGASLPASGE
jgi:hypothetical protein